MLFFQNQGFFFLKLNYQFETNNLTNIEITSGTTFNTLQSCYVINFYKPYRFYYQMIYQSKGTQVSIKQ